MDIVGAAVGTLNPAAADSESAAAGGGSVFWLQNNLPAAPAFVRRDIAIGLNYPVNVHVADLEGDGDADVLAATRDDNRITWYENNGARPPGFTPRVVTTQAQGAVSVHTADIDGNGKLDILSASENDNRISLVSQQRGAAAGVRVAHRARRPSTAVRSRLCQVRVRRRRRR